MATRRRKANTSALRSASMIAAWLLLLVWELSILPELTVSAFPGVARGPSLGTTPVRIGRSGRDGRHETPTSASSGGSLAWTALTMASRPPTVTNHGETFKVAIVGGGPSGLLLAHLLGQDEDVATSISLFERRPDPNSASTGRGEERAYALGIGRRGRTAIQCAGEQVWSAVAARGFASEKFDLHLSARLPPLRLRGEGDGGKGVEPSVLMFQSDLCRALASELESRFDAKTVELHYDCKATCIDLETMTVSVVRGNDDLKVESFGSFDLIVGCDGANSVVRKAMADRYKDRFECTQDVLPGEYKVIRGRMPEALDASAVALLFPASGSVTAFVEPTGNRTACVLFAGRNAPDILFAANTAAGSDRDSLAEEIVRRFPKLRGLEGEAADQLVRQKAAKASRVVCNTFHAPPGAVLVGDAAHATGGVSGQGVNSALVDALALSSVLLRGLGNAVGMTREDVIQTSLLEYSLRQVPEAAALYDLSFGPTFTSTWKRIRWGIKSLVDATFKGRWGVGSRPLQTELTTTLTPFAEIRRGRQRWYSDAFPSSKEWEDRLSDLDRAMREESKQATSSASA